MQLKKISKICLLVIISALFLANIFPINHKIIAVQDVKSENHSLNENYENSIFPLTSEASVKYEWNRTWGGINSDIGFELVEDSNHDIYIAGITSSYGAGGIDNILVKYNTSGEQIWSKTWGTALYDISKDAVIDSNDDIYLVGNTAPQLIQDANLTIVKFNSDGSELWNITWDGKGDNFGQAAVIDSADNLYVSAENGRTPSGYNYLSILKYNSSGQLQWNISWAENNTLFYECEPWGMAVDSFDNIYVTGEMGIIMGDEDIFLLKVDSSGVIQWNRTWGGDKFDTGQDIAIDSYGDIYIVGYTESFSAGSLDVVIIKYNNAGDYQWETIWGGIGLERGFGITLSSNDEIYVTGSILQEVLLMKFKITGEVVYYKTWGGDNTESGYDIIVDFFGNVYIVGSTSSFGAGNGDLFLLKYLAPFTLDTDADDPDFDGIFNLTWTKSLGAINYSVYVHNSFIIEIKNNGTLLDEGIEDFEYQISGLASGDYYFVVIAFNKTGNETSNCILIHVKIPPGLFSLDSNAGNPDLDGDFNLTWTLSSGVNNYSIYQHDSFFFKIKGNGTLVDEGIEDLEYKILGLTSGDYYYIVIAFNETGNTSSNCLYVKVLHPPKSFTLSSTADNPDTDGIFNLIWTQSIEAINYSVSVNDSYIIEIKKNGTLLDEGIEDLEYQISGLASGDYYYVVIAFNEVGNITSNCVYVRVSLLIAGPAGGDGGSGGSGDSNEKIIPFGDSYLLFTLFAIVSVILYSKRKIIIKKV